MPKPEPIEVFDDSDDAEATPRKCVTKASHTTPPKERGMLTILWQIKTEKTPLIPEYHRKLVAALGERKTYEDSTSRSRKRSSSERRSWQRGNNIEIASLERARPM